MDTFGLIAGLGLAIAPAMILGVEFASGNMFVNIPVSTDRRTAPAAFWTAAAIYAAILSLGIRVLIAVFTVALPN